MSNVLLIDAFFNVIIFLIFAVIGYHLASHFPQPQRRLTWWAWIVSIILLGMIDIAFIPISGFAIHSKAVFQGLGLGILIGFLMHQNHSPVNQ